MCVAPNHVCVLRAGSLDGSDEVGDETKEDQEGVVGLEEAAKVLEGETLDEGRVEGNGDGLLEFTDVVLNLQGKGGYVVVQEESLARRLSFT
jgi:hypothetical protein